MSAYLTAIVRDHGQEKSVMRLPVQTQGGTVTITDITSFATTLESAIEGMSLGNLLKVTFSQDFIVNADAPAASPYAQRELGIRFFFQDDVTFDKGYITVPCPDLANITLNADGDTCDLADAEVAAMVTWIETNLQINSGNAVSVDRAVLIGRNS